MARPDCRVHYSDAVSRTLRQMPNAGRAEARSRPRGPADVRGTRTRRACERSLDRTEHARRIASRSVRVALLRSAASTQMNAGGEGNLTDDLRSFVRAAVPGECEHPDERPRGRRFLQSGRSCRARRGHRHQGRERPPWTGSGPRSRTLVGVAHAPLITSVVRAALGGGTERRRDWAEVSLQPTPAASLLAACHGVRGLATGARGSAREPVGGMKLPLGFIPLLVYRHDVPAREERCAYPRERTMHSTAPRPLWSASRRIDDVAWITTVLPTPSQRR